MEHLKRILNEIRLKTNIRQTNDKIRANNAKPIRKKHVTRIKVKWNAGICNHDPQLKNGRSKTKFYESNVRKFVNEKYERF